MITRPKLFNEFRANACVLRAITTRFLRAFSRNRAKLRQFAREIRRELQSHFSAGMANLFAPSGRKAAGASKALPRRISRVFEYFSPNRVYSNIRNFTRNRAISRVPARRYAISWVCARFTLSHTFSRKCNQQFQSGIN